LLDLLTLDSLLYVRSASLPGRFAYIKKLFSLLFLPCAVFKVLASSRKLVG